jgi:hypothetical protein
MPREKMLSRSNKSLSKSKKNSRGEGVLSQPPQQHRGAAWRSWCRLAPFLCSLETSISWAELPNYKNLL